jgi:hyperosmotically inducible protein
MLKTFRIGITSLALLTVLLLGLSGCKRPGTAEHAGRKIDQTVEKVGQQVEKTGQQIDSAAKKIGDEIKGK